MKLDDEDRGAGIGSKVGQHQDFWRVAGRKEDLAPLFELGETLDIAYLGNRITPLLPR